MVVFLSAIMVGRRLRDGSGIAEMLEQGEGLSVEFKRCGAVPEKDTFETVCSFANRQGGTSLLGVNDGRQHRGRGREVGGRHRAEHRERDQQPNPVQHLAGLGDHTRHRPRQVRHRRMGSHGAERLPALKAWIYDRVADVDRQAQGRRSDLGHVHT